MKFTFVKIIAISIFLLSLGFNLNAQENDDSEFPSVVSSDVDDNKERCRGTVHWSDGSYYEGEFRFGMIHGQGKLFFADSSSYEGDFVDETFHGTGTMIYADGSQYSGDWESGYREGEGVLIYPDGREYIGSFSMDQIHGEGAIVLGNGEYYSGNWENGKINGFGQFTRADGSVFIGMNQEGDRHGPGMIVFGSGDTLHGNWSQGKMEEEGIFQFADGSSLVSTWKDGIMMDNNTYIQSDGESYTASSGELANVVLEDNWMEEEVIERNMGLAFYAIGTEYKAINNFELAKKHFEYAAQFEQSSNDSHFKEMVEIQLASLDTELERTKGVARKENDKDE